MLEDHQVINNRYKENLKIKVLILFLLFVTFIVIFGIINHIYFDIQSQSNIYEDSEHNFHEKVYSNTETPLENIKRILSDTQIDTWTVNDKTFPKVSPLSDGSFVVICQNYLNVSSRWSIYGQLFYSNGAKKGNEFYVSNSTVYNQTNLNVAGSSNGKFMVV